MKKNLLTLILIFAFVTGFSQSNGNEVFGKPLPAIDKEKLKEAKLVSDVIPNCPKHWNEIIEYVSINVMAICEGKAKSAESESEKLTMQQKYILINVDKGTEISIKIKFRWKDASSAVGDYGKICNMNEFRVPVAPETEAERALSATASFKNLNYQVRGKYFTPVKKEKLNEAKLMSNIFPFYFSLWIIEFDSIEVLATYDGKTKKAVGISDVLNADQKNILNEIELGASLVINAKYKHKNAVTGNIESSTMHYSATIVPELEAEYVGGFKQMTDYLMETTINKIPSTSLKQVEQGVVKFTVNEEGTIANAQMSKSFGDSALDKLLLEAINRMPKWKPAEDAKGVKVKQVFEFIVGRNFGNGGGC